MRTTVGVLLAVVLALGSGCARPDWIEQTLVTVDVTGTWSGTPLTGQMTQVRLELEQEGPKVKGSISGITGTSMGFTGQVKGPIVGTVAGDVFSFSFTQGNTILTGEMTVSGDEMTGEIRGVTAGRGPVALRRVDSSSRLSPEKP